MRVLAAFVLLATSSCDPDLAPAPAPPDPAFVHIGLLNPFSGREAARAIDFQNAARLAVLEINQAGGVNGKLLDVIARDSKTAEPEAELTSIAAVNELADDGVVAIVGPDTSALVLGIHPTLVERGIPLISPTASARTVATLDDGDYIWRTCASDDLQGKALAGWLVHDQRQTIAIVHVDDTYGQGLAATIAADFTASGGQVLAVVGYPPYKLTDFTPEVDGLLAAGMPDAIIVIGFAIDSSGVMTALFERQLSPLPALYGVDSNHNQSFLDNAPRELLLGMQFIAPSSPKGNQMLVAFQQAYRDKVGVLPFRTEFTYDAIYLIALSLAAQGENSALAVHDGLRAASRPDTATPLQIGVGPDEFARATANLGADLDFQGASGAIDFDAAGDITATTFAIRKVIDSEDGLVFEDVEVIDVMP